MADVLHDRDGSGVHPTALHGRLPAPAPRAHRALQARRATAALRGPQRDRISLPVDEVLRIVRCAGTS